MKKYLGSLFILVVGFPSLSVAQYNGNNRYIALEESDANVVDTANKSYIKTTPKTEATTSTSTPATTQSDTTMKSQDLPTPEQINAWDIEAMAAATNYLKLIDEGKIAESWTEGAKLFQNTITQKEWVTYHKLIRQKLGRVKSRTLKDEKPAINPNHMPKGPYMVIEYNTTFEKATGSERLILMKESNGTWRVFNYEIL